MKILALLLTCLLIESPNTSSTDKEKNKFEGSWTLIEYQYGNDQELSEVPAFMKYVKNITPTHFSWCSYNPESGKVIGMGGGTYHFNKKKYIEKTDFWFPSGTGIPGTETAFDYSFRGEQWTIKGYIKELALNPSSGEFTDIDSTYIVEVWQRLDNFKQ